MILPVLIDSHCHLNDPIFAATLPGVLDRARAAGVWRIIVTAYDAASLTRTALLAEAHPDIILPAFGIHPWFVEEAVRDEELLTFLRRPDTVAIGEIGLDGAPEGPPLEMQVPVLTRQLDRAQELDLPVSVHCRKAHDLLYRILETYQGVVQGVLHSFSGSREVMERFLDLGFYIAFSGSVTRLNARKYHRNAAAVPPDRFLLETDAPSIATETTAASAVEPRHVVAVAEKMATIRGVSFAEVCRQSTENAARLFGLGAVE